VPVFLSEIKMFVEPASADIASFITAET
jgi:hypothetical protein